MTDFSAEPSADVASPFLATCSEPLVIPVSLADGSRFELLCLMPQGECNRWLYWLPAMGVPAKHYLPLAQALVSHGIAVVLHEWRGIGSSNRRASRQCDWGYRELLRDDLPAGLLAVSERWPLSRPCLGGHSLGGQLGALRAAGMPAVAGLVLVASGAPYWRVYRHGWLLGLSFALAPLLARLVGYLPGRRIGFGGNEARGVIVDWARTGRSGRYAAAGVADDLEQRLAGVKLPVLGLRLRDDWLGPKSSLDWLLEKMPLAAKQVEVLAPQDLGGGTADHLGWMKTPGPIAARIAAWMSEHDAGRGSSAGPAA
jgi:predicted alpha/beta hydrolase